MPFKSKAQRRLFWAKVNRGEISEAKAKEWEHETKSKASLPEHVSKKEAAVSHAYTLGIQTALTKLGL
jgi:hypothetical protein